MADPLDPINLTIWMTPVQPTAVIKAHRDTDSTTLYLVPEEFTGATPPLPITVKIIESGKSPVWCKFEPDLTIGHVWEPEVTEESESPYKAVGCLLRVELPRTCFWAAASFQPMLTGLGSDIGPTPATARVEEDKDDALLIPDDGWEIECLPVPGEEIRVTHYTYGQGEFTISAYHSTKGLTGGYIKAKRPHPTVDEAYFYDVDVEGTLFTNLISTDFMPRSVDDWTFLLRGLTASSELEFTAETPDSPEEGEIIALAPLTILSKG